MVRKSKLCMEDEAMDFTDLKASEVSFYIYHFHRLK